MKKMSDITLVLVAETGDSLKTRSGYFKDLIKSFGQTISVVKKETALPEYFIDIPKVTINEDGTVVALNKAVSRSDCNFVCVLEEDETVSLGDLPLSPKSNECYRFFIKTEDSDVVQQNYRIRIFPSPEPGTLLFSGFRIADVTRSYHKMGWQIAEKIIPVVKSNTLWGLKELEEEVEAAANKQGSGQSHRLWEAIVAGEKQNYKNAEAAFRSVLKESPIFEFDKLAALNGLANALVEQHKLKEAKEIACKSIECNSNQRSAYLTLYKVHDFWGQPGKAYQYLERYMESLNNRTEANFDVYLSPSEAHFLMANTKFRQAKYHKAFYHYEEFYNLNGGKVGLATLEKLFIYAIELKDYEKACKYFEDIFGDLLPDKLDDQMSARLLESLSLFLDNEWYEFVSDIYEQLSNHNPGNNELLHGWITTLIKNKEFDKARNILEQRKAS